MDDFRKDILSITDIDELRIRKDRIKNQVTDPSLRWDERMELYKQVQFINAWILDLMNNKLKPCRLS